MNNDVKLLKFLQNLQKNLFKLLKFLQNLQKNSFKTQKINTSF